MVGAGLLVGPEAQAVTAEPVRCSAWLGALVVGETFAITVVFAVVVSLAAWEWLRKQREPAEEVRWLRRTVTLLGAGVVLLALTAIALQRRLERLEALETSHESPAMQQSPQKSSLGGQQ